MSFAENLRQLRKERGLSQEELAERMAVSRQAVSKWELGEGYPEVEKLLLLASQFNISLDSLMSAEIAAGPTPGDRPVTGTILLASPKENVVVTCYKVAASQKMKGGKRSPQYALYGVSSGSASFWGEANTFLGWYADGDALAKEVQAIQQALMQGVPSYELQYNAAVERKGLRITILSDAP